MSANEGDWISAQFPNEYFQFACKARLWLTATTYLVMIGITWTSWTEHVHFAPFAPGNRHKTLRFQWINQNGEEEEEWQKKKKQQEGEWEREKEQEGVGAVKRDSQQPEAEDSRMRCPTTRGNYCKRLSSCDDYTYSWNGAQQADFGYTKVSWEKEQDEAAGGTRRQKKTENRNGNRTKKNTKLSAISAA